MIKKVLLYLWQLPQNLVALFIMLISKRNSYRYAGFWICSSMPGYNSKDKWSAISLGNYILASGELDTIPFALEHERGHQIQSKYFGPLYLILVGIPSFFRATYKTMFNKDNAWYHSGYPEKWADDLGRKL